MKNLAIGIDLGGTNLKGVIMDATGAYRHLTRVPTEAQQGGARVMENILTLIDQLIIAEGSVDHIRGVGIGTPGFVDNDGLTLGGAENLPGWKGTRIFDPIKTRFSLQAVAGNDVTVTALAEQRFGAAQGIANVVCLALGTGLGGGIVTNGHVYKGTHGMAGELGHICVETNGLDCSCGLKGCVEQYASASGIVKNALIIAARASREGMRTPFIDTAMAAPELLNTKIIYDFVKHGDTAAIALNEYVCERLARAIGIVINTLSPDRIILGGGVMMAGQVIVDTTAKYVPDYCIKQIWERCDIVAAQCGENAGVLGAGAMVFDEIAG